MGTMARSISKYIAFLFTAVMSDEFQRGSMTVDMTSLYSFSDQPYSTFKRSILALVYGPSKLACDIRCVARCLARRSCSASSSLRGPPMPSPNVRGKTLPLPFCSVKAWLQVSPLLPSRCCKKRCSVLKTRLHELQAVSGIAVTK